MSVQNAFSDFELLNGRQLSNVYMNNAIRTYIEYLKIHVGKYEKCDFGTERKKTAKSILKGAADAAWLNNKIHRNRNSVIESKHMSFDIKNKRN